MGSVWFIFGGGAMPLVEKWLFEHMNKIVEQKAFLDSRRVTVPS